MSGTPRNFRVSRFTGRLWPVGVLLLCISPSTTDAQLAARSDAKPTSLVVLHYEKFVSSGAMLTPDGWKRTAALYQTAAPYPANGSIFLKSTGGNLGETWREEDRAEVQTKWTDSLGTIDSNLKYKPPHDACGAIFVFNLVAKNGQWKIQGRLHQRTATPEQALRYVTEIRDISADPVIKRNAEKTIATLKRLQSRYRGGNGC